MNEIRKHQERIARRTLEMPAAMRGVMGGPTVEEAREILPTQHEYEARAAAERMGREHGVNAAVWWMQETIGGHASGDVLGVQATARKILAGIEEGDPETLDTFPIPDLSGEWADGYTVQKLAAEVGLVPDDGILTDDDLETMDQLGDAYEDGFLEGVTDAIGEACGRVLS